MARLMVSHKKVKLVIVASIILTIFLLLTISHGEKKMQPSYNINETKTLKPEEYDLRADTSLSLFPVPQDNSIGTNDLSNAITLLSFHKGEIKYDKYFKNAIDDVEGGGEYIPVIAPDTIGFGQTRRFLLYNFRSRDVREFEIVVSLEKTIEKIAIADAGRRQFIFEIEAGNPRSEDPWDVTYNLLLMDLSGKEAKLIKNKTREEGVTWSVVSDRIFLYDYEKESLQVFDMNFEPAHHPLEEVLKKNKRKVRFIWIQPHPYLNFAILHGGKNGPFVINWAKDRDTTPNPLLSGATQFSFSPDGRWLIFKHENFADETFGTYLMPVSEKYPDYLGTPILLLNNYFNPNNCNWTTNPISFVGSSSNMLYRWELTKEAYPWIDKPTLHDYVVDYDLGKLKKEKGK
jgi:hypothetical protein